MTLCIRESFREERYSKKEDKEIIEKGKVKVDPKSKSNSEEEWDPDEYNYWGLPRKHFPNLP